MNYLKCNKCGYYNPVKTEYLTLCAKCHKKLDNSFSEWKTKNPGQSFENFRKQECLNKDELVAEPVQTRSAKKRRPVFWIGLIAFVVIVILSGNYGVKKFLPDLLNEVYDKAMVQIASEMTKNCPIMLDAETRLDNVESMPGKTLQYNNTLVNFEADMIDINLVKEKLKPNILNIIKTNPDLEILRLQQATFSYNYKDKNGRFLFNITINPGEYEK